MHNIKRKYVIKAISFFIAFFLLIFGIFLQKRSNDKTIVRQSDANTLTILTSITASINEIQNSFNKASVLNNYESESKIIYANSFNIKNLLSLSDKELQSVAIWFSDLSEYAKTPMTDIDKNNTYSQKIEEANKLFINICNNYRGQDSITKINNFFTEEKDSNYYNQKLSILDEQYTILEKQIKADRKEVNIFAKKVIGSPLSPNSFTGNYQFPKSVNYTLSSSYASIFASGKILARMASFNNAITESNIDPNKNNLEKYINEYAYYLSNYEQVYSYSNNDLTYYIICPIYIQNDIKIINYNEPIKIAVSKKDGSLKAFDSTKYLKNHTVFPNIANVLSTKQTQPDLIKKTDIISQKHAFIKEMIYYEYKTTINNNIFYCLIDQDNTITYFTEKEYLSYTEII
ncbi:MAG: hypothetical protein E7593_05150 [Ruminococcaceae bacterium]|nr:hypothetical protein [Oscillospiraceae bacterium]